MRATRTFVGMTTKRKSAKHPTRNAGYTNIVSSNRTQSAAGTGLLNRNP